MAEYIGTTISLISKSDIRYVGKLHEINQENSTVALENVRSHGTEGRKQNPDEEIPPSDSVYEYIVFRGSDVKDLRIEEEKPKENVQPQPPSDPAILNAGARRPPPSQSGPSDRQVPGQGVASPQQGPPFGGQQPPQYPPFYPPPPGNWGRGGPPPHGFPPMPYGAPPPPGWFPPPGQGFPQHGGPFPPYGYPPGPPGQFPPQGPPGQQNQGQKPTPIGPGAKQQTPGAPQAQNESKDAKKPIDSKSSISEKQTVAQPESQSAQLETKPLVEQPAHSAAPKSEASKPRVQPALPLQSPAAHKSSPQPRSANAPAPPSQGSSLIPTSLRDATQAASAAVAAAMAKLPGAQSNGNGVDNLTKKIDGLRTNDPIRAPRQPGSSGHGFNQTRGGRGGRGGNRAASVPKEVPTTDFDFESANAKFNKEDLVKEAIAGSPLTETAPDAASPEENPAPVYNKTSSFFDNISSDAKDRAEGNSVGRGGRERRGEEHKKNVETFGQGNVDNAYRGGYRGRGRGRGRGGFRGRGYNGGGYRGGYRGDRNDAQTAEP